MVGFGSLRFKLTIHRESKPIEAYVLEVAKREPKLEKAVDSPSSAATNSGHAINFGAMLTQAFSSAALRDPLGW